MAAVSDSSPLILFARIGRLDLIRAVFGEPLMPPAVWREVVTDGVGRAGAWETEHADWIHRRPPPDTRHLHELAALHPGEAEAIALAASQAPPLAVLVDDGPARRVAREIGLVAIGSGGLLVLAKNQGHLPYVGPLLTDLQSAGLYLGHSVARRILERAGER